MSSGLQKKTYTVVITTDRVDGGFIGKCEELHAYSQGETYGEIMANMKEAIEVSLDESVGNFNMLIVQDGQGS